jgi:regulator of sigma E protease
METTVETGVEPRHRMGDPGWYLLRSDEAPIVGDVLQGEPAERAGLRAGDRIVGAEGEEPIGEVRLRGLLKASPGVDLVMLVERGGARMEIPIRPDDRDGEGRIGAVFYTPLPRRSVGAVDAIVESVRTNVEQSAMLFVVLKKLFRTEISMRAFSGPLEIAQFSRAAVGSLERFLSFLALLSLQLGILNLLPIPVLDGGHIVILTVEGVMRRELSDRVKERVMLAGLLFLLAFFGVILTFDVLKLGS